MHMGMQLDSHRQPRRPLMSSFISDQPEKVALESTERTSSSSRRDAARRVLMTLLMGFTFYYFFFQPATFVAHHSKHHPKQSRPALPWSGKDQCKQVPALTPRVGNYSEIRDKIHGDEFKLFAANTLSKAVTFPTVSFDDLGEVDSDDERWLTREPFIDWLRQAFPALHEKFTLERVNKYGLVYTWEGTNSSLKPVVLMAHYDVVPVADRTIDQWTYPPFDGHYDGEYVWGRGSSDDKNQLLAGLQAMTLLIDEGFVPSRTIIFSFGADEEISGSHIASGLGPHLVNKYGKHGVEVVVDEGAGFFAAWGQNFATPATGEKGHVNVRITLNAPGGHSSIPYAHTAIGVAADLIKRIERHPYAPAIHDNSPFLGLLHCANEHAPEFPKAYSKLLRHRPTVESLHISRNDVELSKGKRGKKEKGHGKGRGKPDHLAKAIIEHENLGDIVRYLFQTSLAVDTIRGGVKVNALPEQVEFVVNHRVNVGERVADVLERIEGLAKKTAREYNYTLRSFDGSELHSSGGSARIIRLATDNVLEPAPVSPLDSTAWAVLSGTIRAVFGEDTIVAPGLMTGNTDTRWYWNVSPNIFRYNPSRVQGVGKIHTVDENMPISGHLDAVSWFWTFIRNMDEQR
ncbi:hypothetical protein PYCC9005_004432 [Savitreella phatthalungensis]